MFLNLDDVKRQLNTTGIADDVDITAYILAAETVIERHTGRTPSPADFTDQLTLHNLSDTIRVTHRPLISVTSVTVEGVEIDLSGIRIRPVGLIRLPSRVRGWVDVVYSAGEAVVPKNWVLAGSIIVQHLWASRRGNMQSTNDPLGDSLMDRNVSGPHFAIPNKALELLGSPSPKVF